MSSGMWKSAALAGLVTTARPRGSASGEQQPTPADQIGPLAVCRSRKGATGAPGSPAPAQACLGRGQVQPGLEEAGAQPGCLTEVARGPSEIPASGRQESQGKADPAVPGPAGQDPPEGLLGRGPAFGLDEREPELGSRIQIPGCEPAGQTMSIKGAGEIPVGAAQRAPGRKHRDPAGRERLGPPERPVGRHQAFLSG